MSEAKHVPRIATFLASGRDALALHAWRIYLAVGGLALLVYLLLPADGIQRILISLFSASAVVAICIGVRLHRPARPRAWLLLAIGLGTIDLGNVVWAWYSSTTGAIPAVSIADAAFLGGYGIIGISLLTLFRGRVPGGDRNGLIDATIVTVGLGMVSWVFFMDPYLRDVDLPGLNSAVAIAYPLADVLLLGVAARLFLPGGPRPTAVGFLAIALAANVLADIVNAIGLLAGTYEVARLADAGWAIGFLAFGAFALHPTMHDVDRPVEAMGPLRTSRVVLLAAATLMAPLVMVIEAARGESVDVAVVAPASVILFVLVLTRLATVVRDLRATLVQRAALETQLSFQALHDPLTGLANRRLFTERLAEAIAARRDPAVLFLDLDDFKVINDTLGHAAGDEALIAVAERLRVSIRPTDTPARLGGDEFGVLLLDCPRADGVTGTATRLLRAMDAPVLVQGRTTQLGMSIGMALSDAGRLNIAEILRNADIAMYMAKTNGKGGQELYRSSMGNRVIDRERARDDLEAGITRGEIAPHYQPIVDLRTGEMRGVEALARWQHPERGLLMPADFIPLAEATGLIVPLGAAMVKRAVADVARMPHGPGGPLVLHVNLSVFQLRAPGLVGAIERTLASAGFDPARLVLEITESSLIGDHETSILTELKAIGVRLAIDDFGTGYSALGYLRRLPIDMIKLDRSFVSPLGSDRRDSEIVRWVVQLARSLDLDLVAEGIEDDVQRVRLVGLGCEAGQGYLFSKAVPAKAIGPLLGRWAIAPERPPAPRFLPVGAFAPDRPALADLASV
ncbi:MAG TPA: EAL domain-containing protein [Candidatus Limnocylindrales bacterium]|nr:EAL domain-containing protein [Candidatus Limnocylindrales bacterium]